MVVSVVTMAKAVVVVNCGPLACAHTHGECKAVVAAMS